MVHVMVRRGIEHPFKRSEFANKLGMKPRLIGQHHNDAKKDQLWRKTNQEHRQMCQKAPDKFKGTKPYSCDDIIIWWSTVSSVLCPQYPNAMCNSMLPIIGEICCQNCEQNYCPGDVNHPRNWTVGENIKPAIKTRHKEGFNQKIWNLCGCTRQNFC